MKCRICGGKLESRVTDLPFKLSDTTIVVVKAVPALQCVQCNDIELERPVMIKVEKMLDSVDEAAELEVMRYAA
jgi:YgiT-type zinc finger domain-containing protein